MSGIKKVMKFMFNHRPSVSTVLELAGFVALSWGVAIFSMPIALIVSGVLLIVAGGLAG
jgi:hypothetical protein